MINVIRNIGHMIRNIGHMTSNSVNLFRIVYDVIRNIGHMISNSVYLVVLTGDVISDNMNLVRVFRDVIRKQCLFWRKVDFNTNNEFSQIIFLESNFFDITRPKGKSDATKSYAIVNTLDWKKSTESSEELKKFEEIWHMFWFPNSRTNKF